MNAAEPLIKALQRDYPNAPLVITTVTPTGMQRVQQLFGDSVFHVYLPYDLPFAVQPVPAADPAATGVDRGDRDLAESLFRLSHIAAFR